MSNPNRVTAGIPTGGQFAPNQHAESDVDLSSSAPAAAAPADKPAATKYLGLDAVSWRGISEDDLVELSESAWTDEGAVTADNLTDARQYFANSNGTVPGSIYIRQHYTGAMSVSWTEEAAPRQTSSASLDGPDEYGAPATAHMIAYDKRGTTLLNDTNTTGSSEDAELLSEAALERADRAIAAEVERCNDNRYDMLRENKVNPSDAVDVIKSGHDVRTYLIGRENGLNHGQARELWPKVESDFLDHDTWALRPARISINHIEYWNARDAGADHAQAYAAHRIVTFLD